MGEHGEALPLGDPPQQAGERAVGLGGADDGAQDRGRGLDSRVGHNIRCCGIHSLRPLQRIHAAPRLGLPCLSRLRQPDRVIAQVLEFGDFDSVLRRAQPGWFSPRSWSYWHLKLGLSASGAVPPLPQGGLEC
jgi:hypothetical protein